MNAKDSSSTPRRSSATSGWREMPSMHRPEAMPWPTPEPIAAKPMAKPAPMADKAGIHTEPSSANAACGVTKVAAVKAAAVPVLAVGADTWELLGAGTKAVRNAPQLSSTAPVRTKERAISNNQKLTLQAMEAGTGELEPSQSPVISLYKSTGLAASRFEQIQFGTIFFGRTLDFAGVPYQYRIIRFWWYASMSCCQSNLWYAMSLNVFAALSLDSGDLVKFQIYEDLSCMMLPGKKKETVKGAKRSCPETT